MYYLQISWHDMNFKLTLEKKENVEKSNISLFSHVTFYRYAKLKN